ncbi:hypothetical protein H6P81_020905 [Aristolochia fimbriata]|uniref:Uncharacterized protein n=1 Tax=Aristolochia fimbriata TaxID=158543 RepID=A0AAV7DXH8_ARIFI|nr:hypothetical protein H6P81_020905 [Aristolochia fimbriata]
MACLPASPLPATHVDAGNQFLLVAEASFFLKLIMEKLKFKIEISIYFNRLLQSCESLQTPAPVFKSNKKKQKRKKKLNKRWRCMGAFNGSIRPQLRSTRVSTSLH